MERIFPSGERFILCCAARNVITAEWNAARAGNVISRSEYGKLRRHWETSRIFFRESPCSRRLLHFFGESAFPFSFPVFFSLFYFFTFQCAPLLLFSDRLPSCHCTPAIKGFTRTNRPCSPRGSSWNSIFFSTPARERCRRGDSWIGAVCALFLSPPSPPPFSLSSDGKSIGYRRKSSGNPGERVVATRKRRNEVSSRCSGSRPTLRFFERASRLACGNIAYRAYRTDIFEYDSSAFLFSFLFSFLLSLWPVKFCVAMMILLPNSFSCSGQIEISSHYSIMT